MLVSPGHAAMLRVWRRCVWISLLGLVLCLLSLVPYLGSSTELVRLRNAWLLGEISSESLDWTPANVPVDYLQESGPVDPFFSDLASRLNLAEQPDDWARAMAISRHLLSSSPVLKGEAVKADLRSTYTQVVAHGDGYCGDFVDVFVAIALAGGMQVRTWSFSFDGFGGHGHVWPEIWNRQLNRWQLVDVFNNYYFFEADAVPLSALGFRKALLNGSNDIRLAPLDPGSRPGWAIEAKAWDYYRRGLPGWYTTWGNNVFTYDRSLSVRLLSGVSRPLEQFGTIVQGTHPPVRLLIDASNQVQVRALQQLHLHLHLIFFAALACMGVLAIFACSAVWTYGRRGVSAAHLERFAYDDR